MDPVRKSSRNQSLAAGCVFVSTRKALTVATPAVKLIHLEVKSGGQNGEKPFSESKTWQKDGPEAPAAQEPSASRAPDARP
jgi:hypothetical protein